MSADEDLKESWDGMYSRIRQHGQALNTPIHNWTSLQAYQFTEHYLLSALIFRIVVNADARTITQTAKLADQVATCRIQHVMEVLKIAPLVNIDHVEATMMFTMTYISDVKVTRISGRGRGL